MSQSTNEAVVQNQFFGIFSYQIIVSGSKIDNIGSRNIAHPAIYDSSIHIDFPRSSLRTNKQTERHAYFINIYD